MQVEVDELERQFIVLGLAILGLQRPGWDRALVSLADKFDACDLYESFRQSNADKVS